VIGKLFNADGQVDRKTDKEVTLIGAPKRGESF